MSAPLRLLSARVLLMLLGVALAALALASALSPAAPARGTQLASSRSSSARISPHEIVWN